MIKIDTISCAYKAVLERLLLRYRCCLLILGRRFLMRRSEPYQLLVTLNLSGTATDLRLLKPCQEASVVLCCQENGNLSRINTGHKAYANGTYGARGRKWGNESVLRNTLIRTHFEYVRGLVLGILLLSFLLHLVRRGRPANRSMRL